MGCNCTKESFLIDGKKFSVINRIAEGGFGSIDLVEESQTGQAYALKRVKCEGRSELEHVTLENKYYKQLNSHSNTVKLICDDIVEDRSRSGFVIYSVFPYYQNGNLQTELELNSKHGRFLKTSRMIKLFQGIASGLHYIHESKLAHRDLKPQNVLLSDDRTTAVLTDFGSMTEAVIEIKTSRKVQEIQDWAAQNCSMFYRAPELFSPKLGVNITTQADVWSLGCMLFALMFNKGPFDYVAERGDSIALAVTNVKFTFPTDASIPSRPDLLATLVRKTIVFEMDERESLSNVINSLNNIPSFEVNDFDYV